MNEPAHIAQRSAANQAEYLRIVAELQEMAKRAPHVTQHWVLDVASMDTMEMRRRLIRSYDWQGHFNHSLDGIDAVRNKPGAAPDGCWDHRSVRSMVEQLITERDKWEKVAKAQDAKLRAMTNEPGGIELLRKVLATATVDANE